MTNFVPGLKLSRLFYQSEVKPILDHAFPRLPHAAALIGWGSEVLTFPQQRSLEFTSGEVYYDSLGQLSKARERFRYYPRDIWLYMMAAQWIRIAQEEALVGRTARLVREIASTSSRIARMSSRIWG